uniref:Phosphatidylinositol-specific phospholipase C X domain-containing protein n=1 Tax=Catharus ustulatus TaxID=91951 RepID=A0A8C3TX80_CATUS
RGGHVPTAHGLLLLHACCPDWMAELPDALPLSRLSIPGTHDSLSLFGGRRLRCQSWGLEAQLAAGIRFLDVRCKLWRGELRIYHLCTFQRASLRGVLRRTLRFLRAHPGEAVLMRIKEELPIFSRPGFAAQLQRCLLEEGQGCVWCREEVPTLGQVRGKIVVLEALAREVLGIPYEQLKLQEVTGVRINLKRGQQVRRNIPFLVILAFVSLLQGFAPEVRILRQSQLQQGPPMLCLESWMATEAATQTGLPCPWGHTPRDAVLGRAQQFVIAGAVHTGQSVDPQKQGG